MRDYTHWNVQKFDKGGFVISLKSEYKTPVKPQSDSERQFTVMKLPNHDRVVIQQDSAPHNTSIPMQALVEIGEIVNDWNALYGFSDVESGA